MSTEQEEWKSIAGSPNREISSLGNMRIMLKGGNYKPVKHNYIQDGYLKVNLKLNGKTAKKRVHRLVADAFLKRPDNGPLCDTVHHINGDRSDNRALNLKWVTLADNLSMKPKMLMEWIELICKLRDQNKTPPEILDLISGGVL